LCIHGERYGRGLFTNKNGGKSILSKKLCLEGVLNVNSLEMNKNESKFPVSLAIAYFVLIALSYVVNAMDRQVFAQLIKSINTEYHLSLSQGGLLSTIFAFGFGITGIIAGYLLDRWSRKTLAIIGIVIYSVFTLLIPFSFNFWDMGAYRIITGIGEALQQTAIFTIAGAYFASRRSLAIGGLNFAYGLGAFTGPILGVQILLLAGNDWRAPLYIFGAIGLVFCVILWYFLPKAFSELKAAQSATERRAENNIPKHWFNRNVILISIANVMVGLSNFGYNGLYPTFLKDQLHYSPSQAALCASMYGVGALMGLPAGYLGDKFNQKKVILAAVIGSMIVAYFMFNVATAPWLQIVLSFLIGTFGSGFLFVNIYSLTQSAARKTHIGKASGIASSAHYIGAAVAGLLFGYLIGLLGWGNAATIQMVVLPIITIVSIAMIRMKDTAYGVDTSVTPSASDEASGGQLNEHI
jgi:MFS family permease